MADENSSAAANDSGPRSGRMLWRKASGKIAVVASAAKFQELFKSLPPPKPVNPSVLSRVLAFQHYFDTTRTDPCLPQIDAAAK